MPTILRHLSDSSFLSRFFSYLEACHGVRAQVVDRNGNIDPLKAQDTREYPQKKLYPLSFRMNIGGIRCSAESAKKLAAADPHIQIGIAAIETLLEKDLVTQQTTDEVLRLSDQIHFLFGLAAKLSGVHDIGEYCEMVLREIAREIAANSAFARLNVRPKDRRTIPYKLNVAEIRKIEKDKAIQSLPENKTAVVNLHDGRSAIVVPIRKQEEIAGRLVLLREAGKRNFSAYEKKFVSIINNIVCPTMESLSLYGSLQILYLNTVRALAAAIDAKDAYTHGHSYRVARYSLAIARQLDTDALKLSDLEIAAYMHDLGKIGIPESILGKEGKLSAGEFAEIKKHPVLTNKILEPIDLPDLIVRATLQHHERMDGRGYPFGLKGDQISQFARIIAVADVFDALTSARPYRGAMTVEDALREICEGIDTEYDRHVVRAFIDALQCYSEDQDLSVVYSELEFAQLDRFNQFLENLTGMLPGGPDFTAGKITPALKNSNSPAGPR